jgi:hypothetical protein
MLIGKAPRIEFRLHRTRSVYFTVQNRYLEQVVVITGNLSARPFPDSSQPEKKIDDAYFELQNRFTVIDHPRSRVDNI